MPWKRRYKFKKGLTRSDMQFLSPDVLIIFSFLVKFAERRNLPVVITSIKHDRAKVRAKSRTHSEGRAIDISTKNWSDKDIAECAQYVEIRAGYLGAYSASDGVQRPFIYKGNDPGNHSDHIHLQSAE